MIFKTKKAIIIIVLLLLIAIIGLIAFLIFNKKIIEFSGNPEKEYYNINISTEFKPDSLSWKEIKPEGEYWSGRDSQAVAVFKGKIWLSGGVEGGKVVPPPVYEKMNHPSDLWVSSDLKKWEKISDNVSWKQRRAMTTIVFKNKLWLLGGWEKNYGDTKNDIWTTENGKDWKKEVSSAEWAPREGHSVVEFKGKLWIAGGVDFFARKTFNDVWYSEDGKKWVEAVKSAPWTPRYDQTLTVYKDKLWLIGGYSSQTSVVGDVWVSEDGINWTLMDKPPWPARHGHLSFDYKGLLWIIGGWCEDEEKGLNDTWYTEDGINWGKLKSEAKWYGREDLGGIIWNDKIVMMGGMADEGKEWEWRNDIWELSY